MGVGDADSMLQRDLGDTERERERRELVRRDLVVGYLQNPIAPLGRTGGHGRLPGDRAGGVPTRLVLSPWAGCPGRPNSWLVVCRAARAAPRLFDCPTARCWSHRSFPAWQLAGTP